MRPPTMDMPRGWRSSEPTPLPMASGSAPKQRGHGRHHYGAEPKERRLVDGLDGTLPFLALGIEGKVDDHDPIFLHDADEEDYADEGDNAELGPEHEEGEECAHHGGRQGGNDREGVDVAFIENAEDDVDHYERRKDEEGLVGYRCPEDLGRPLEAPADARRQLQPAHRFFHRLHRLSEGRALFRVK